MFSWFNKPKTIKDPVFGEIMHMESYWEGRCTFEPVQSEIEVFIDADPEGPNTNQHELFKSISGKYSELQRLIYAQLSRECDAWAKTQVDIDQATKLKAIAIPKKETPNMEIIFMYSSNLLGNPSFDVFFNGWSPSGVIEVST